MEGKWREFETPERGEGRTGGYRRGESEQTDRERDYRDISRSGMDDLRQSYRSSHLDRSRKYQQVLENTLEKHGNKPPHYPPVSVARRKSENYTLRADKGNSYKNRGDPTKNGDKRSVHYVENHKKSEQRDSILESPHICLEYRSNCKSGIHKNSNSPVITLSIAKQKGHRCECQENRGNSSASSRAVSTKSHHSRQVPNPSNFTQQPGPKDPVLSPPSRKSSAASEEGQGLHSGRGSRRVDSLYNLIHAQNDMIRQITTELIKNREITAEVEVGLKIWKADRKLEETKEKAEGDTREQDIQDMRKHNKMHIIETSPENPGRGFERISDKLRSQSQERMKSTTSEKSGIPISDFENKYLMKKGKPRCSSVDNHQRKAKMNVYKNPVSNSTKKLVKKKERHHDRCCLKASKESKQIKPKSIKTSKEKFKLASPYLQKFGFHASTRNQPSTPFFGITGQKRFTLTARKPTIIRPMHTISRHPSTVVDALADVIARRLKVELRP